MTADLVATYWAPGEFPSGSSTVLDACTTVSFLAELRSAGQGSIEQMNDATTIPAAGGVVTFDVKGTRAFASICKTSVRQTVALTPADQRTTWDMPGHLSIFSKGLVTPTRYVGLFPVIETIAFNWTHPDFDESAWTSANFLSTVADAKSGQVNEWGTASPYGPWPWSDDWAATDALLADIIGPDDGSVTDVSNPNADDQNHYFRQVISVSSAGAYRMAVSCDNYAEFYVDGVLIGTYNDWRNLTWLDVHLTVGFHVIAVFLHNYPATIANPCGYSWALYSETGPFLARSTAANTVHVEYQADPPGMSVGQTLRLALVPHIDAGRAWALALTLDFDDVNDSDGNPWPTDTNITAEVGRNSLLDLILKLQQSYADIVMDPNDWTLHAYNFGAFTPSSGVTLTVGSNITTLTHKSEEAIADELLVRSDGLGWSTSGSGEVQGYAELGTEVAGVDVGVIGNELLALYGVTREEITASFVPAGDSETPWKHSTFVPGSIATAPDSSGSPSAERVLALGCGISEGAENLQVAITLKDRIQELNERMITELKSQ